MTGGRHDHAAGTGHDRGRRPRSPPLRRRIGAGQALANALTLAWRNVTQLKHSPEKLLDVILMPIVFLVLFLYVFGGAVAGSTHAYLELLLPGLVAQMAMFATMGLGTALCEDIHKGVFDRFRSLPIARSVAAGRRGARRHGPVLRGDGGADRVRLAARASASTPGCSRCWPRSPWPTCSTWRCAGSRC